MRLAIVVVLSPSDDAIVAPGIVDDFEMPPMKFVRFLALTIEGGDRLLVLG